MKIKDIAKELAKSPNQIKVRKSKLGYIDRDRKTAYRAHLPNYLNDIEEQIIYGSLLGDAFVTLQKKKEFNFRECHSIKQLDYIQWKCNLLKRWDAKLCIQPKYKRVALYTPYHDIWQQINSETYQNGRKTITVEWLEKIDYLGLAALIGDDGTRHGNGCRIATNCFNGEENDLIVNIFSDKFGVKFQKNYRPSVGYFYVFIPAEAYRALLKKLPVPKGIEYKFI